MNKQSITVIMCLCDCNGALVSPHTPYGNNVFLHFAGMPVWKILFCWELNMQEDEVIGEEGSRDRERWMR